MRVLEFVYENAEVKSTVIKDESVNIDAEAAEAAEEAGEEAEKEKTDEEAEAEPAEEADAKANP